MLTFCIPVLKEGWVIDKELKLCFPVYVFLRSLKNVADSILELRTSALVLKGAYYFLCYGGDKSDMALWEDERNFIERLVNAEFCMESSVGFIEGDYVKVVSSALMGIGSQIITCGEEGMRNMSSNLDDAFKDKLINILTDELKVLRAKAGISQQDLAERIGVSRQTYGIIESKKQKMAWSTFLSLLFLFEKNEGTAKIIHQIGAHPLELESYLKMNNK